jgi:hypothetical protein
MFVRTALNYLKVIIHTPNKMVYSWVCLTHGELKESVLKHVHDNGNKCTIIRGKGKVIEND